MPPWLIQEGGFYSYLGFCLSHFRLLLGSSVSYFGSASPIYYFVPNTVLGTGNRTDTKPPASLQLIFSKHMICLQNSLPGCVCVALLCFGVGSRSFWIKWQEQNGGRFLKLLHEKSHYFLWWNFSRADRWTNGPHIQNPLPWTSPGTEIPKRLLLCESLPIASLSLGMRVTY